MRLFTVCAVVVQMCAAIGPALYLHRQATKLSTQTEIRLSRNLVRFAKFWHTPLERSAKDMIPHAGGHAEITAMG
jgi:hypothetical protein